jgi:putative SOS response-associated peptidase YedK
VSAADGRAVTCWPQTCCISRTGVSTEHIDARNETVAEKPSFRHAFRKRRCLVPADAFYEWQAVKGRKQPSLFEMKDGGPFALAGLWEEWHDPAGAVIESCTVLTTEANELVCPVHDRMPVIVPPKAYAEWLDPDLHDPEQLQPLLRPTWQR